MLLSLIIKNQLIYNITISSRIPSNPTTVTSNLLPPPINYWFASCNCFYPLQFKSHVVLTVYNLKNLMKLFILLFILAVIGVTRRVDIPSHNLFWRRPVVYPTTYVRPILPTTTYIRPLTPIVPTTTYIRPLLPTTTTTTYIRPLSPFSAIHNSEVEEQQWYVLRWIMYELCSTCAYSAKS